MNPTVYVPPDQNGQWYNAILQQLPNILGSLYPQQQIPPAPNQPFSENTWLLIGGAVLITYLIAKK